MPTLIRQENTLLAPYEPPPVLVERAGRIGNITTLFGAIEQRRGGSRAPWRGTCAPWGTDYPAIPLSRDTGASPRAFRAAKCRSFRPLGAREAKPGVGPAARPCVGKGAVPSARFLDAR